MDHFMCDVIGCRAPAVRRCDSAGTREEYLCQHHWGDLMAQCPDVAVLYVCLEAFAEKLAVQDDCREAPHAARSSALPV